MGLTAKDGGSGEDFQKAPEGSHMGRCFKVIDLGTQYSERWDNHNHKVMIVWELPEELIPEGELAGQPFAVAQTYTLSLGEKANLRKDLEAWRGKSFTEAELAGFNIANLIGKSCYLGITYNVTPNKTYVNVTSIMKLPKGTECPKAINEPISFDLDNFDQELFDSFSDGLQKWIMSSTEYQEMTQSSDDPPPIANDVGEEPEFEDDDIPF